jgi:hypothetical protein
MANNSRLRRNGRSSESPACPADAQIILQLYDLRREPEMRKARQFMSAEFWPDSAEDILRILRAFPSRENTWLGQVTSYWEMAASLVLRGALHEGLFFDCSGEMYCMFAKFKPYLEEVRERTPKILVNVEQVIMRSQDGRERMDRLEKRIERGKTKVAARRAAMATAVTGDV